MECNMGQYRRVVLLGILAILALSTHHLFGCLDSNDAMLTTDIGSRSLRYSIFFDPKSILPQPSNNTLTIHLIGQERNPARDSIFKTDILDRYATGRLKYIINPYAPLTRSCSSNTSQPLDVGPLPCLVVFSPKRYEPHIIKCNYPLCKTMVTNDEFCQHREGDIREYYAAVMKDKGYLPLGPRVDAWNSFVKIQQDPLFSIKSASERKYAFNAIFSYDTGPGRANLGKIVSEHQGESDLYIDGEAHNKKVYKSIAKWDKRGPDNPRTGQIETMKYMEVLLDSIFTLAPAGHNPECFRLYEAVEAGSIPIILRTMLYNTVPSRSARCSGSLHDWHDAPIVMINSWDELYPKVTELLADLEALNEMQIKLRLWYDEHMQKVVSKFEDFMILSS